MTDESDQEIAEKIRSAFGEFLDGTLHLVVFDNPDIIGRPPEAWHDEIVECIDEIRESKGISAAKAAKQIRDPYLKQFYVTEEGFMTAYWRRRPEYYKEKFLSAIADRDMNEAIKAFKQLPKDWKERLTHIAAKFR